MKCKDSAYYRIKYERITKRRGKKRAIIAVARRMLTAIFHMLSTGEGFNPSDLLQIDMPQQLRDKQRDKAFIQAIKFLVSQGIVLPENLSLPVYLH